MMKANLNYEQAVSSFLRLLLMHVRNGVSADIMHYLDADPPGLNPDMTTIHMHTWFQQLDTQSRQHIQQLISNAVDRALFSSLVILDGAAGGYPVPGVISDFALYVQTYDSDARYQQNQPAQSIRINPPNASEDLHDLFRDLIDDMDSPNADT
jgi:hypothetical protein